MLFDAPLSCLSQLRKGKTPMVGPSPCRECARKGGTEIWIEDYRFSFLNPVEALCTSIPAA